jgi:hypothetical protein
MDKKQAAKTVPIKKENIKEEQGKTNEKKDLTSQLSCEKMFSVKVEVKDLDLFRKKYPDSDNEMCKLLISEFSKAVWKNIAKVKHTNKYKFTLETMGT